MSSVPAFSNRRRNRYRGKRRRYKNRRQRANDTHVKRLIANRAFKQSELKSYMYIPQASGTVNTTGLKMLLNAMPWANATVTAGVVDSTPGVRGSGPQQVVGKVYFLKTIRYRLEVKGTTALPTVIRVMILRELAPEGTTFLTGPNSLLYDVGAGNGVISPVMQSNLISKGNTKGRFKIYFDKTFTLAQQIAGAGNEMYQAIDFKKTFTNPVKVETYDTVQDRTQGTNAVITNIMSNAFYALVLCGTSDAIVQNNYVSIDFYDQ